MLVLSVTISWGQLWFEPRRLSHTISLGRLVSLGGRYDDHRR